MQINLEPGDTHSIQAYADAGLKINNVWYAHNLIINSETILTEWSATSIRSLDEAQLRPLLELKPEIIIIGHEEAGSFPPMPLIADLTTKRIGLESMSISAACRTFNVLLSEYRNVVLGIIRQPETAKEA